MCYSLARRKVTLRHGVKTSLQNSLHPSWLTMIFCYDFLVRFWWVLFRAFPLFRIEIVVLKVQFSCVFSIYVLYACDCQACETLPCHPPCARGLLHFRHWIEHIWKQTKKMTVSRFTPFQSPQNHTAWRCEQRMRAKFCHVPLRRSLQKIVRKISVKNSL